jgi:ABC-type polysaccharide/polyol phosphate export permease
VGIAIDQLSVELSAERAGPRLLAGYVGERLARLFSRANLEILTELLRAQLKESEQGSIVGLLWSLLNPIVTLAIMYAVFGRRFGAEISTYPLYLLVGIVLVSFFSGVTRELMTIFPSQRSLLANMTVPGELLALSRISMSVYKLLAQLVLCLGLSVWYGYLSLQMVALTLPLLASFLALSVGIGLTLCIILVFCREVAHLWGVASRLLLFATPIFYSLDGTGPWLSTAIYWFNPLTPFLISFREAFMGGAQLSWGPLLHCLVLGPAVLVLGYSGFLFLQQAAVEKA